METGSEVDAVLEACGDAHRRIVLAVLVDQQRTVTTDDLTKAILKHNHHTPLTEADGETLMQIKTALHHVHIPKLVDSRLVEYDSERSLVEPTAYLDQIRARLSPLLDADSGLPRPAGL